MKVEIVESDDRDDALHRCVRLSNGVLMPMFGLGTFEMKDEGELRTSIPAALKEGYRLIDTAQCYRNEASIGSILWPACADLGLRREDIFLISKLHPSTHGYDKVKKSIDESLRHLQVTQLDLFLVHWPGAAKVHGKSQQNRDIRLETWRAIEDAYKEGKLRAIGVSNYTKYHLEEFLSLPQVLLPMVNQIEVHPAWHPLEDISWCEAQNIAVQAYSSLGRAELLQPGGEFLQQHSYLRDLAHRHCYLDEDHSEEPRHASIQQVFLRWAWQHHYAIIPKSRHAQRVVENADAIRKLILTSEDMSTLDGISAAQEGLLKKICWDPRIIS